MGWSLIQSGMRSTLAHKGGMVPGAGGKVSFNAEPEIAFDSGENTIRSLSTNTFNKGSSGLLKNIMKVLVQTLFNPSHHFQTELQVFH